MGLELLVDHHILALRYVRGVWDTQDNYEVTSLALLNQLKGEVAAVPIPDDMKKCFCSFRS